MRNLDDFIYFLCHYCRWGSNPFFKGAYSYRTISADRLNISPKDLAKPLTITEHYNGKEEQCPKILFAGEATEFTRYGTLDGAMMSAAREAKRLANFLDTSTSK